MGRAWAFKGGRKRWGGGGRNNQQSGTNCIDIVLKWVISENGTIHTHHPLHRKLSFFKYFLQIGQTAARHYIEGVREGQASFPLWSQQSIWTNFLADWRINTTARQPKTFLHPKKTRPISELKHTFRTTPRYGQYLTHAHIYITRTVKENACSLTNGKREIKTWGSS